MSISFKQFTEELIGANADFNPIVSYPITTGTQNWKISVFGVNRDNNDDFYKSNLNFIVVNQGTDKIISPSMPVNILTGGDGYSWNVKACIDSDNINILVQGLDTTNWSIYGNVQEFITTSDPAAFSPSQLSDLIVWLRADSGVVISDNITNWADQSTEGNDVIQLNNTLQATYNASDSDFNNRPTLSFNGSSFMDSIGAHTYPQPNTIIVCGKCLGTPADDMMVGSLIDGNRNDLFAHNTTQIGIYSNWGAPIDGGSVTVANPIVAGGIFNGASSSGYINDSQSPVLTGSTGTESWIPLEVGATLQGGQPMTGTIAEVIAYNRELSSLELQQVFLYLGRKYNITTL